MATDPETTSCHESVVMRLVTRRAGKCRFYEPFSCVRGRLLADIKLHFPETLATRLRRDADVRFVPFVFLVLFDIQGIKYPILLKRASAGTSGCEKPRSLFELMCSCQSEAVLLSFGLRSRRWGAASAS